MIFQDTGRQVQRLGGGNEFPVLGERKEARVPGEVLDTHRQNEAGEGIELAVIQQLWWPEEEPGFHHETSEKPLEATAVETS